MARVGGQAGSKSKRETAAQRRARLAQESVNVSLDTPARRGEDDETAEPRVITPPPEAVETAAEREDLRYEAPPAGASDSDKLLHYERLIARAQTSAMGNLTLAHRVLMVVAGRSLKEMHSDGSWRSSGHTDWNDYAKARWHITGRTARNWMDAADVYDVLGDSLDAPLNVRQVEKLKGILKDKGAEAVREAWEEARRTGKTSPAGLEAIRQFLALGPAQVNQEADPRKPTPALARVARATKGLTPEVLRKAREENPEEAAQIIKELRRMLEELEG